MSEGAAPREVSFNEAVSGLSGAARDEFVGDFLRQAREAHRKGELATAELAYRHVLQLEPDNADALGLLGMLAAQTGHLPQALALLDRAVERAPGVADFHINRGNILRLRGQFEEAAAAYRAAIAIDGHAVLNFGLPDLAGRVSAALDIHVFERILQQTIWDFEPRILRNSLSVRLVRDDNRMDNTTLAFEIEGELWGQPLPLRVFLKTEIDLDIGEVRVSDYSAMAVR